MTVALTGMSASVFRDDDTELSVAFTEQALVNAGDNLTYQISQGLRYWDSTETLTIECDDGGGYDPITTGFKVNYLRGSITFTAAQDPEYLYQATGKRRDEDLFDKILLMYDGRILLDGRDIDTTNVDDDMWGSSITGSRKWSFAAKGFYYDGCIPIEDIGDRLLMKIFSFDHNGYHRGGASPSIDISGGTDTNFKILVDEEVVPKAITLVLTSLNTGAKIAAEMETEIQAAGAPYDTVTVTYEGVDLPGAHFSGASPSIDISAGSDCKFKIQADSEGAATEVTLTGLTALSTGIRIADEMQRVITALGGAYANVKVHYRNGLYEIVSGTFGPESKIRITDGASLNVADNLKIGTGNGGSNVDGSGGYYKIMSGTRGPLSKVRITDGDTNNVADNLKIGTLGTDVDGAAKSFIGTGCLASIDNLLVSPTDAQKQDLTFNGDGELYPEL